MARRGVIAIMVGLIGFCIGTALAQDQETNELIAMMLNMNGLLCAEIVTVSRLGNDRLEVTCIEYRGGHGTVRYILDMNTGRAFKAG